MMNARTMMATEGQADASIVHENAPSNDSELHFSGKLFWFSIGDRQHY